MKNKVFTGLLIFVGGLMLSIVVSRIWPGAETLIIFLISCFAIIIPGEYMGQEKKEIVVPSPAKTADINKKKKNKRKKNKRKKK